MNKGCYKKTSSFIEVNLGADAEKENKNGIDGAVKGEMRERT